MNSGPINEYIREAKFAGQFYPGTKKNLNNLLIDLFAEVKARTIQTNQNNIPQAIIVPHAGYVFSGLVSAAGFSQIVENTSYKRVFVIASSHRYSYKGAAVYCSGNYLTPLGEITVDKQISRELLNSSDLFIEHKDAHENEHSIEVQLPFIQHKLGENILLVPIILGTQQPEDCRELANILKKWFTPENLWIISTDFSHYPEYKNANIVDQLTADAICSNQSKKLLLVLKENKNLKIDKLATSLCGWTSVLTLMYMTENEDFDFKKNYYQNSGDAKLYGSKDRVVGYWSITVCRQPLNFRVSHGEKEELIGKARESINYFVLNGVAEKIKPHAGAGILNEKMGAFVSIYVKNKLRGCIGSFAKNKTLNEMVQEMAVSASHDRRFDPIKAEELDKTEIEISVLSPLKKIDTVSEIELGKHGIYIKQGNSSGTFLPQVATKTGWNLEEFLGHCSRDKAGIGREGWKNAEVFIYEAIVFRG